MTKKSAGREARDEFKSSNTAWDDLREQYLAYQSKLNLITTSIQGFFAIEDIAKFIPPQQADYTVGVVNGLASDVKHFQQRLNDIYKQHSDKSGKLEFNDADYVKVVSLGSQYVEFFSDFCTILDPLYKQALGVMATIEERVQAVIAEGEREAEQKAAEGQPADA